MSRSPATCAMEDCGLALDANGRCPSCDHCLDCHVVHPDARCPANDDLDATPAPVLESGARSHSYMVGRDAFAEGRSLDNAINAAAGDVDYREAARGYADARELVESEPALFGLTTAPAPAPAPVLEEGPVSDEARATTPEALPAGLADGNAASVWRVLGNVEHGEAADDLAARLNWQGPRAGESVSRALSELVRGGFAVRCGRGRYRRAEPSSAEPAAEPVVEAAPVFVPDDELARQRAADRYWPRVAGTTPGPEADGIAAGVAGAPRDSNPHAAATTEDDVARAISWDCGWWLGAWRRANPASFEAGYVARVRKNPHVTEGTYGDGSIEYAEYERGFTAGQRDRGAREAAVSADAFRAACPHPSSDEAGAVCARCGIPWSDARLAPPPATVAGLEPHRFAQLFPMLSPTAVDELAADILRHGQRDDVVLFDGKVLDGRNRLLACERAGVPPRTVTFQGTEADALAWVLSKNLHRRHLSTSQRGMVASRLADAWASVPAAPGEGKTAARAAQALNVSTRLVEDARVLRREGAPELVAAVDAGQIPVTAAAAIAAERPVEFQRQIAASLDRKVIAEEARKIKEEKSAERRQREQERRAAAAAVARGSVPVERVDLRLGNVAEVTPTVHGAHLVLADPPWKYGNQGNGGAQNHYDGLPVATIVEHLAAAHDAAAADAYLVVWVTDPFHEAWFEAVATAKVRRAWPWRYLSGGSWGKRGGNNTGRVGAGVHMRGDSEPFRLYAKGNPKPFATLSNHFDSERDGHSGKPVPYLGDMIETFTPKDGLVYELYAGEFATGARACLERSRPYIGAEIDPVRHAASLAALTPALGLFDGAGRGAGADAQAVAK